jgi:hypothetical protein
MNAIALGMNLFLAVLLLAALGMGWRLERRLRSVRDSQAMFVKAVSDLDAATGRAHAGLSELRAATDEAIDLLGGRIVRAREAAERLDRGLAEAEALTARRAAPQSASMAAPMASPERRARDEALAPTSLRGLLDLAEGTRPALRAPAPAARPRPMADDDLFVGGGLR